MPIRPARLQPGDTVGLIAPASAPPDPKAIDRSVAAIERLGFRVKLGRHTRRRHGFLAGTDRERAGDLMAMVGDRKIRAIISVRGGYGTARLMPLLDYGVIRANPKIIIGYSDLTSLHCAFLAEADLVSFHGPMTNSDFIKKAMPEFTLGSFLRTLGEAKPAGSICFGYSDAKPSVVRRGVAQGALIGGNLSILCATVGTRYLPSFRDKILFLEDLDEVPYRFDRMLTHLLNARLLQQVAGVAVGINANCGDPKAGKTREYRQTVEEVIEERLGPLKVPVVIGLPFGHVPTNATLPVGIRATLDARRGDLIIEQAAVV